jgi:GGDEF domain-containing protein
VQNAIARAERESLTDAQSGLPSGKLIEDQLRKIIRKDDWAFIDIRLNNFEAFKEVYGFIAASDVLRYTGMLIGEVLDQYGTDFDFIGHAGGNNFVIITKLERSSEIQAHIKKKFSETIPTHYNFVDRQQGFISTNNDKGDSIRHPIMTISTGIVSPKTNQFADIREITEMAAEARRMDISD